jgi:monofunctional glycosyltransferase
MVAADPTMAFPRQSRQRVRSWGALWRGLGMVLVGLVATGLTAALWFFSEPRGFGDLASGPVRSWSYLETWRIEHAGQKVRTSYVPLSRIAVDAQYAVIAGEDINFFGHDGFDLEAMREAWDEWRSGAREQLRGASTLTQQLAKNLFLDNERSLWRKLEEARYAYWLEKRLGKRRILELYLNMVELGAGVFGFEAGARHYFGVSAAELSAAQAAALAATIPSPLKHNPETASRSFEIRRDAITLRMGEYANVRARLASSGPTPKPAVTPLSGPAVTEGAVPAALEPPASPVEPAPEAPGDPGN